MNIIEKAAEIGKTDRRSSIDYLFEQFDELYWAGKFEEADAELLKPDYNELSTQMLVNEG